MSPLAPSPQPPDFMSSYGTNDEIFLSLNQINHGSPVPDDVIDDNPFQYDPSNLPDGAWFLVRKNEEKETKHGLWGAKGPACEIFANSAIIGWRTTFEFFQFQAAIEQRIVWMMQEYKVTTKWQHDKTKSQEFALCRFFSLCNDPHLEPKHDGSVNSDTSRNDGRRSIGEPQVNSLTEGAGSSLVDKSRDQAVNDKVAEMDCFSRGDYLELDDLADAASHSSSSVNSSCQSFKSDEYFDSLALLAELDDDKKEDLSGKGSTSNHSIMMCGTADNVVVQPAPLGLLVKGSENAAAKETQQASNNNKSKSPSEPSPEQAAKKLKAEVMDECPSHACRAITSSRPRYPPRRGKKRWIFMKYLCFMPC